MSASFESLKLPTGFTGIVRLFPLPNLVLFPGVIQPLHIFEPRYRQLVEDSLAADELIATALMKPGWEQDYEGRPPIHPAVCIGRIITHTRLDDGRFNLLLQGVQRARIDREIGTDRLYRVAEIHPAIESGPSPDPALCAAGDRLRERFLQLCHNDEWLDDESKTCLLDGQIAPGTLADLVAFAMDIPPGIKQQILDTFDPKARVELVFRQLQRVGQSKTNAPALAGFPPCFSSN